jgi:hypothetical protein
VQLVCRGYKNRRGFAATVLLVSANYGLNKSNVFLIAPSYKKTPHERKGLRGCFGRGFFEGRSKALTDKEKIPSESQAIQRAGMCQGGQSYCCLTLISTILTISINSAPALINNI